MFCPYDHTEMHQVQIESHYGQPIFLEQCTACGGIWFDESELYRAKQGQAEKIDSLDAESLWSPATLEDTPHVCPRDQETLFRFEDKNFPAGIIVERCPLCDGFWFNRGGFTTFQKARQELLRPKERTPQDLELEAHIKELLAQHRTNNTDSTLSKLGRFLSTPVDENTFLPLENDDPPPMVENAISLILKIIIPLLRTFIFR
jgi:Zn-finger nucleic acid-binding protein